jgi:hypothetical protein
MFFAAVRGGHTEDDTEDYAFPFWCGLVPVSFNISAPIPDPRGRQMCWLSGWVKLSIAEFSHHRGVVCFYPKPLRGR